MNWKGFFSSILCIIVTGIIRGQFSGDLDPTLDSDGIVTTDFSGDDDEAFNVVVQPDGKIILGGYATNGGHRDIAIIRYNSDGSLDNTFDGDGKMVMSTGVGDDMIFDMALQTDGKIVCAGYNTNSLGYQDLLVVRFNPDGSPDVTFDSDGIVTTSITDLELLAGLQLQSDGKIVVGGTIYYGSYSLMAVVRYNSDGSTDNSFGTGGIKLIDFGVYDQVASCLELTNSVEPKGGDLIYVGGYVAASGGYYQFALARLMPDGDLDNSFNSDGLLTTQLGSANDVAHCILIQPDGKIILGGVSQPTDPSNPADFALVRYTIDGDPDVTFDNDGIVTTDFNISGDVIRNMVLQPDGKIVAGGSTGTPFIPTHYAIARYNTDGNIDLSFNGNGKVITDIEPGITSFDAVESIVLQPDLKLLAAGATVGNSGNNFSLARYFLGLTVSISESDEGLQSIILYPNPFTQYIYLSGIIPGCEVKLMNAVGQLIDSRIILETNLSIAAGHLSSGIYYLQIQYKHENRIIKLIK